MSSAEPDSFSDLTDRLERLSTSGLAGLRGFGLIRWEGSPVVEGYGSAVEGEWLSRLGHVAASSPSRGGDPWGAALGVPDEADIVVGLNLDASTSLIAMLDASTFLLGGSDLSGHRVMAILEIPSGSDSSRPDMAGMGGDASRPTAQNVMVAIPNALHSHGRSVMHDHSDISRFVSSTSVEVFGESWTLNVHTMGGFLETPSSREVLVVAIVGGLLSLALFVLTHRSVRWGQLKLDKLAAQGEKLEATNRLAAGIAHEINTPMQYISDNTRFLSAANTRLLIIATAAEEVLETNSSIATGCGTDLADAISTAKLPLLRERAPKAAAEALAGVENVSRIVQAMKRFSQPEGDTKEPVDINDAIATTLIVCRNEWKHAADVQTNLDPDLPLIEAHLGLLNQVWLDMIVNAAHAVADRHSETKGTITITTAARDGHIIITIADNGAGIEPDDLSLIFDQFFTTKDVGKGIGQGLAIARQAIVNDHHGTITVDSTHGQGTTFTITLPVTSRSVRQEKAV